MAALNKAIQNGREELHITPGRHPERANRLSHLGDLLSHQYSSTGVLSYLNEAIQLRRATIEATPKDHPKRPGYLNKLAIGLIKRYSWNGPVADLQEAIQVIQTAVDITPENHPDRRKYLHALATALHHQYFTLKGNKKRDLDEFIHIAQTVIDTTPKDYPDQPRYLHSLATKLALRFSQHGNTNDLNAAIQINQAAIDTAVEYDPNKGEYLQKLAVSFYNRYALETLATADLTKSISLLKDALHHRTSSIIKRIESATLVFTYCREIPDWQQGYAALNTAVNLVRDLMSRSLEVSDRQDMLNAVSGLACNAAAAALYANKEPSAALDVLERGRWIFATSLEANIDISEFQRKCPELAEQYIYLQMEREHLIPRNTFSLDPVDDTFWQTQPTRRHQIERDIDDLAARIRRETDFRDFLRTHEIDETDMRTAAKNGPLVVINVTDYRSDAFLVEEHQIRSLCLTNFDMKKALIKVKVGDFGSLETLQWLWDVVTCPILNALGFTRAPSDNDQWPHLWWIPTGVLTLFPLHASGYHDRDSSETVLDRVMSSYSSSIKAIVRGRRNLDSSCSVPAKVLLVGMEHTPGSCSLPFVRREVAMLHDISKSLQFELIEPQRQNKEIMRHLPDCKIFHFAGHGNSDDDPLKSHLLLEGGKDNVLTVGSLVEMNLHKHGLFLAYLSACSTSRTTEDFADECIHLTSGFQLAGFRHVIGTLWEVNDKLCVDMAKIMYEEGMKDGCMTDQSVCRGLHKATREVRKRLLKAKADEELGKPGKPEMGPADPCARIRSTNEGDYEDPKWARDILCVDDGEWADRGLLRWVPYVHYGV
jgi:hypothetical protein